MLRGSGQLLGDCSETNANWESDSFASTDHDSLLFVSNDADAVDPNGNSGEGPRRVLDNEVAVDPWSSMESSNSPLTESGGPSAGSDPETAPSEHSPQQPIVISLSKTDSRCYGTTRAVIEPGPSPKRTRSVPVPHIDPSAKAEDNGAENFSLDLEQIELIDDAEDSPGPLPRKPHFLDDDYHLQSTKDACRIPKPHFLDHSPSPDDEKPADITDPHFLDDIREERKPGTSTRRKENLRSYNASSHMRSRHQKDGSHYGESSDSLDRRHRRSSLQQRHCDFLPGQTSTSGDRNSIHGYDGGWPGDRELWQSQDSCSVKSFSSAGSGNAPSGASPHQPLGNKVNCVYSLLSLLSLSADSNADMSEYLLDMSHTVESCIAMRQSGCIPLLVQLIHSKLSRASRNKAARALHNMVHAQPDDKAGRREARVLRLLEQVREYCDFLEDLTFALREEAEPIEDDMSKHPAQSVAALMKLSFDEEHRHVMCQLGGLQSLAALVSVDQAAHGSAIEEVQCVTMRKYSGMALTNLTFGDGNNKALLCSFKDFMMALVDQLQSPNDDMRQVTAAVLRNLSWRADTASKQILREVGAVKGLTIAAMTGHKEATLKSVLSALWNLTAHCSLNKVDICSVDGALAFLVDMLSFNAPSKNLAIIENAGGILRNVSSHIAVREDYRQVLREHNCLKVLLQQLKSLSLTIVSNSCGTLWNLSARCHEDQQYLWDHGAVPLLRSLIHSKHKMIAMGSSAALKNLLNSKPGKNHITALDSTARDLNLPVLPTLGARKQKALEQEIDQNLSETCENIEPTTSPTTTNRDEKLLFSAAERHLSMSLEKRRMSSSSPLMGHLASQISLSHSSHFASYLSCSNTLLQSGLQKGHISRTMLHGRSDNVNRSESRDSVTSTHSDSVYERVTRNSKIPNHSNLTSQDVSEKNRGSCNAVNTLTSRGDREFIKRYSKEGGLMKYDRLGANSGRHTADNISRNNYSELEYDESDTVDQPIDYSRKYSEKPANKKDALDECQNIQDEINQAKKSEMNNCGSSDDDSKNGLSKKNSPTYGDYQETDLDQPTDYSLRYAEDQSDAASDLSETRAPSVHEDTIKYFCTEGTPYETPINFSTATSMSDLRGIGTSVPASNSKPTIATSDADTKNTNSMLVVKQSSEEMSQSNEKEVCSIDEPPKHDNDRVLSSEPNSVNKQSASQKTPALSYESKFSSGVISPEKPVNYCEEGTPGYFSRVSSLSSLEEGGNGAIKENNWSPERASNLETDGHYTPPTASVRGGDQTKEKDTTKVVTFGNSPGMVNYAEETPLMFSRCSSLGSLSGCSVPDQPDDIGSIVSEFSRMTSGCISPSELPDSPTQSPLPGVDSSSAAPQLIPRHTVKHNKSPPQPPNRLRSVFEDEVSTFKCEHTPVEFSTATSLSSLTIDDEPTSKVPFGKPFDTENRTEGVGSSNPEVSIPEEATPSSVSENNSVNGIANQDDSGLLHCEPDSEDLFAACISAGMQSRIKTRMPIPESMRPRPITTSSPKITPRTSLKNPPVTSNDDGGHLLVPADTCQTYCTEDTPAPLSKVGSHSDLSVLSVTEDDDEERVDLREIARKPIKEESITGRDFSDDSSNLSGESDNLLAECIRSGMPKKIHAYTEHRSNSNQISETFLRIPQAGLPAYLISQDETENYAMEGSPLQHSMFSSLSDLTIDSNTSSKAKLIKRVDVSTPNRASGNGVDRNSSPTGSLSSVSLGSDDGRLLDMAIQAGVQHCGEDGSSTNAVKKSQDSPIRETEDKSDERVTTLGRHDSLSSLSVDSMASNEGEQALFEQCIESGMPKSQSGKWEGVHSKTLDKNFKARSAERDCPPVPEYQNRIHKSLERKIDDRKEQTVDRDPEFENLVVAGAFPDCAKKLTKAEEDNLDRALLEEAIYCGMPKRRDKSESSAMEMREGTVDLVRRERKRSAGLGDAVVPTDGGTIVVCSKNVQGTSAVAGCDRRAPSALAARVTSDVKTAVEMEIGNTATVATIAAGPDPPTDRALPCQSTSPALTEPTQSTAGLRGTVPQGTMLPSAGDTSEDSRYSMMMKNGSKILNSSDQVDGDQFGETSPNANDINDFKESTFDESNEWRASNSHGGLNISLLSDVYVGDKSNESFAMVKDESFSAIKKCDMFDMNTSVMSKTLVQSIVSCSSMKFINQPDSELTMMDSITERETDSSSGKRGKPSSADTWNENTCPDDVSFPTVSGSVPMIGSFKSDLGDENSSAGGLPDLLEKSLILSDSFQQPDLTNRLSDSPTRSRIDDTPTNENQKPFMNLSTRSDSAIREVRSEDYDNLASYVTKSSVSTVPSIDSIHSSLISDESSRFTSMTNSTMIENEAARLAMAMRQNSYDLTESVLSLHSLDLDNVKPPSLMGSMASLTQSLSGNWEENHLERDKLHSSLTKKNAQSKQRKKSLPVGIMIRRALGNCYSNQGSSENLDSIAVSNLDNIKPPLEMDDIFDMENSMISVASIVSEVADFRGDSPVVFDFKQPFNGTRLMSNAFNLDIDNINPPSLFDELTESTLEMENDSDEDDECLTHTLARCPEINSGSESGTPIASDFGNSSAESTPKKIKTVNRKYLTPKQKRQLARDRYKTYTIAAEMAIKEEDGRKKMAENNYVADVENLSPVSSVTPPSEGKERKYRPNPKQRRQEDRARYQTQTVDISNLNLSNNCTEVNLESSDGSLDMNDLKNKLEGKKTMKQKRLENVERFRTQTLDNTVPSSPEAAVTERLKSSIPKPSCSSSPSPLNISGYNHFQLAADASRALEYLRQHSVEEAQSGDLDCETISLVSNEDDSELNSARMKTFTKSFRNYLPVIESPTAVDKCIEKNLKNISQNAIQTLQTSFGCSIKAIDELQLGDISDLNSLECDQNSGTESADQNLYSDSEVETPQVKGKPKITKPSSYVRDQSPDSNGSIEGEGNIPKTIRGRRKALYVSPYKKNSPAARKSPARNAMINKSSKINCVVNKATSSIATRNPTVTKGIANITKLSRTSIKSPASPVTKTGNLSKTSLPRANILKNVSDVATPPKSPLVRQGTFTKEDVSTVLAVAASKKPSPNSKLTKPGTIVKAVVNTSPSRLPQLPTKISTTKPPLKKTMSNESAIVRNTSARSSSSSMSKPSQSGMKNSSSNQSLQSNDSGKTIIISPKTSATAKCSSSSSVNSGSSTSKPPPKDVTSKIANLWKKVEQSKKLTTKPDMRVWISNNLEGGPSQDQNGSSDVPEMAVPGKLIRSSTFEGPPKAPSSIPTPPPKQKSSIAIRVSQSPSSRYNSKVPVVRAAEKNISNGFLKRGKT